MRIFLSSTAYDLSDLRAFTVNILEGAGHEVLFHESPTFPARVGLHSHDQCIEAVADSDLVICLIDRRFGGRYAGALASTITDQKLTVLGCTKSGKRKKYEVVVPAKSLSITWIELITAHEHAIPVVTFARQRTLDEKETRRRNQFLTSFMPAYAEKNELFDFIDWITKQSVNNWIAPFHSIVDYEKKLQTWMRELEKTIPNSDKQSAEAKPDKLRVCILVEGEMDRMFVSFLVGKLSLNEQFVIVPIYRKSALIGNFKEIVGQYAKVFDRVIVLLDSDAKSEGDLKRQNSKLQSITKQCELENLYSFLAHPTIEAWMMAGLDREEQYVAEHATKEAFTRRFGMKSLEGVRRMLEDGFSYKTAMKSSGGFKEFVEFLSEMSTRKS